MALAVMLAACGGDPAGPEATTSLDRDVAAELGLALSDQAGAVSDREMARPWDDAGLDPAPGAVAADVRTREVRFRRVRRCPGGGDVVVAGRAVGTLDMDEGLATLEVTAQKHHRLCTLDIRGHGLTIQADGGLALSAHRAWKDREPHGLQTHRIRGSVRWRLGDGRSGRCRVRLQAVTDPGAGTRTVRGEICGREVDRTRSTADRRG